AQLPSRCAVGGVASSARQNELFRADELLEDDRNQLRPTFAALHGSHAMRIPDTIVARIRHLDATLPKTTET
ncbi:hypothetical protein, partial [Burkholderia sp. BDU5]|uniref:hypothetical protein n=1 Tax=Burkholderia sp. BDU5 TaxID=1385590 RepID=UPI000A6D8831